MLAYLVNALVYFATCKVIQDSLGFWNPRCGFRIPGNGFWIPCVILLREKFLQFDGLRAVVFQLNLKYLHVKMTNLFWVIVWTNNSMICTWCLACVSLVIFQNCLKFTYNNFEISLVVFFPNITSNHAITYTNFDFGFQSLGIAEFQLPWAEFRIPKPRFEDSTRKKNCRIPGPDYISLRYMGRLTGKQEGSLPLKLKDVYGEKG